ncbi:MAG: hypothetical protein GXP22_07165 [Gammaproteobacteria bacterium]|nr:hypothetical protein [Gammaproteobacteria bacterium]
MSSIPAINAATQGIQRGLQGLSKSTAEIAKAGDITQASVDIIQNENLIEASAKAVKLIDDTLGSIIDTQA